MLKQLTRHRRSARHLKEALARIRQSQRQSFTTEAWVDLATNSGGKGDPKTRALQQRSEILALTNAVAEIQPQRVLEIETYGPGTTFISSQIAEEQVVTCAA